MCLPQLIENASFCAKKSRKPKTDCDLYKQQPFLQESLLLILNFVAPVMFVVKNYEYLKTGIPK